MLRLVLLRLAPSGAIFSIRICVHTPGHQPYDMPLLFVWNCDRGVAVTCQVVIIFGEIFPQKFEAVYIFSATINKSSTQSTGLSGSLSTSYIVQESSWWLCKFKFHEFWKISAMLSKVRSNSHLVWEKNTLGESYGMISDASTHLIQRCLKMLLMERQDAK